MSWPITTQLLGDRVPPILLKHDMTTEVDVDMSARKLHRIAQHLSQLRRVSTRKHTVAIWVGIMNWLTSQPERERQIHGVSFFFNLSPRMARNR